MENDDDGENLDLQVEVVISDEESDSTQEEEEEEDRMGVGMSSNSDGSHSSRRKVTFDREIPATHSYLGGDLEDIGGGQQVMEEDSVVDGVPLFPVPGLILVPGQTLPIQSLHPRAISMFRHIISHHNLFVVVNMMLRTESETQKLASIGTIAQVVAYKEQTESEVTEVKIRAVGRQRAKLLDTKRQLDGTLVGKLRILPEIGLQSALHCAELGSIQRYKIRPLAWKTRSRGSRNKYDRYWAAPMTPWPWFLYRQYDLEEIVEAIVGELSKWYEKERVERMAENRVGLSYWVASNLPIDDDTKLQLLGINCSLQRLRAELALIRECSVLCCRKCGQELGEKAQVFSMSVDGPMGAYVNPHGYLHEMLTLLTVRGVQAITPPTTDNSWFPGYAWSILQCARCRSHLGWKFISNNRKLKPSKFWGLTRASILPKFNQNRHMDGSQPEPT